ncbi:MAG: exosortase-associated EpsI family protein, partial [Gammaproteobacteria bacterium]|nr:exosortase-associated EpsI family protein [Gammaproteobacteria bacterium]
GDLTEARNRPYVAREWRRAGLVETAGYTDLLLRPGPAAAAPEGRARIVWWWYAVNGAATSSRVQAKVAELGALVGGGPVRQAYVVLSATVDGSVADARLRLRDFAPAFCRAASLPCPGLPVEAGAPDARTAALRPSTPSRPALSPQD